MATVLVDGDCALCSTFARFVSHYDAREKFYFDTQQSEEGQELLKATGQPMDLSTVVVVEFPNQQERGAGFRAYTKSTAVLRVLRDLAMPWPALYVFILIPAFIRDAVYMFVARYRLVVFGRNEACKLPPTVLRKRLMRKRPPPHEDVLRAGAS